MNDHQTLSTSPGDSCDLESPGQWKRRNGVFFRFHVKCNVAQTYCARIIRERETSENKAIVLGFGATVQQKESDVRAHMGG